MSPSSITPTASDMNAMSGKLRNLVQAQRPDIKIDFASKQKTYTTLDRIEGTVTIRPHIDTNFDTIEIDFVGTSLTSVERITTAAAATGQSHAQHQFLKLQQPELQQLYPEDLVLKAGRSYSFPFVFAVPEQLLPRICQHTVDNDALRDAHLRLPPTFGDKDIGGRHKGFDDLAPDMASIRYGIFVKIAEIKTKGDEIWGSTIASKARRLRVIPAVEEQPPLDVHQEDGEYTMRKEKTLRKGVLKGKLGTLVMEATQPAAFKTTSYNNPNAPISTMATIMLRFDPIDKSSPPPNLEKLSSKLKVTTYFASTARQAVPTKKLSIFDVSQGSHTEQLNLSSRCVANVEWTKQDKSLVRRDSATSNHSLETGLTPEPSEGYKGGSYYTARVIVPLTLPSNKAFVPTFHTCLISRVYTLKLDLSISSAGIGPSVDLKVPVQISSECLISDELARTDSMGSTNEEDVDVDDVSNFFANVFEPRTTRIASQSYIGRSRIGSQAPTDDAPPGYSSNTSAIASSLTERRAMSVPVY